MSRSGYSNDYSNWDIIRWRGAVASAIRGKRGQELLREMAAALDAMPNKCLIAEELELNGEVCALGCVGKARGLDMTVLDPHDPDTIANNFGVSQALVREIEEVNDNDERYATPEQRWEIVRNWVRKHIKEPK